MRLTEKKENGFYKLKAGMDIYADEDGIRLVQIVGQYEDIEEELGIDLITLFEALKNGIWIKKQGKEKPLLFFYKTVLLCEGYLYASPIDIYDERVSIDKYGKTWALTKEELL